MEARTFTRARRRAGVSIAVLAVVWGTSFVVVALPFFPTVLVGGALSGLAGLWVRAALPTAARPRLRVSGRVVVVALAVAVAHLVVGLAAFRAADGWLPALVTSAEGIYGRTGEVPLAAQLVLAATLTAPLEELFWRGAVQPVVGVHVPDRWWRVLAAAAIYTLFHVATLKVALVAAAALGGLVWGTLLERTRSVGAAIIAHGTWTALMLLIPPT